MSTPRRRRRHALAAGAALAAALVALTGCGAGGGAPTGAQDAGSPVTARASGPRAKIPMLPDSKLTPATGSFTEKEKKYLSGRVPADTDPAAVLQLGQEACQRVARTARHDRDAAVGAVIAGDIPGAEDAIARLCPDQSPILKAAEAGFPDGTKDEPRAGTYRALTQGVSSCAWRAVGAKGRILASKTALDSGSGRKITAKVPAGTRRFVSSGCYAWVPA